MVLTLYAVQTVLDLARLIGFYDYLTPGAGLSTLFMGRWNAFLRDSLSAVLTGLFLKAVTKE